MVEESLSSEFLRMGVRWLSRKARFREWQKRDLAVHQPKIGVVFGHDGYGLCDMMTHTGQKTHKVTKKTPPFADY